jgi:peptidoglycan/LPS O-acetylase OafA/YrhL
MCNPKDIFGLHFLRAIAILMVLIAHALFLFDSFYFRGIELLFFFGFYGVEIFFVLSGFLIGNILYQSYIKPDFSLEIVCIFWVRRWLRTLPNYFLALSINLLLAFVVWKDIPERVWSYFIFLQNSQIQPLFFNESWSISIEEYAYVLLPVVLILFIKIKNRNLGFISSVVLLLIVFGLSKLHYHNQNSSTDLNYWNTHLKAVLWYRIDAIIYGVLAAWMINNFKAFADKYCKQLFVVAFLVVVFLLTGIGFFKVTIDKYPLFWNVFYLPVASLSVLFFLPLFNYWQITGSVFAKPIVFISKISYSIYLFHYFIILYLYRYIFEKYIHNSAEIVTYIVFYFAIVFIVSFMVYTFFEKPILKWRDDKYP